MEIIFEGFKFLVNTPDESGDPHNVYIVLKSDLIGPEELWICNLMGLWRDEEEKENDTNVYAWQSHKLGDYFQQTIKRNGNAHPHFSYTALFHRLLASNESKVAFIKNLYSTSGLQSLSFGYCISDDGNRFWGKQVTAGLAVYIESEKRYHAII